ncbi:FG-GAP-like repeat-containing protein [Streptomyces broussonetiae]|uniref:ATP/GTP-binding protein n=1 Tax=Streptomyces broussonetiae TaxID=2686304 RepID=A0A6I6MPP5_9ACTN|nr:FG-GAP-like repeat-containing protein [Streptomyces broussonetiae]QHA02408.1 ATP/GTP-binding protein [Streptomyces broussonetiae]
MNRRLRQLVVTAGSLALAAVTPAVPAQAATTSASACPSGYLCGWSGTSETGSMVKARADMPTMGSWDNRIRSFWNRTPSFACLYTDPNFGGAGTFFSDAPGQGATSYSQDLDRNISSLKFVPNERECDDTPYAGWYAEPAPSAPGFGDLNGDGRADLLSRDRSGRLWFVSGTGDGALVSGGWNSMTALTRHGDLNGDGTEDLIARDSSGTLWFYPGTGKGRFGARKDLGGGWKSMATITATGDLGHDGHGDLLARDSSGTLWLYPGTGHGTFGTRTSMGGGWKSVNALTAPGDLNGDGHGDLIARDTSGRLWLYPGNGRGSLGTRKLIGSSGWGQMSALLGIGDVDGDGRLDLVAATQDGFENPDAGPTSNQLRLYVGNGKGSLAKYRVLQRDWYDLNGGF